MVGAKEINPDLLFLDVWENKTQRFKVSRREGCPACQGHYEFLDGRTGVKATSLCGQNAVQVLNPHVGSVSFEELAKRLKAVGKVSFNEFMLTLFIDSGEMVIFPDGRAIVKNTDDLAYARGLYAKYIGASSYNDLFG